jgi:23S rRNA (adenine2503-C2)-methyltransferase
MPDGVIATTKPISKVNLLGMTRAQLEHFFAEIGEKKFRAQQVMKWIHHQGVCERPTRDTRGNYASRH